VKSFSTYSGADSFTGLFEPSSAQRYSNLQEKWQKKAISKMMSFQIELVEQTFVLGSSGHDAAGLGSAEFANASVQNVHMIEEIHRYTTQMRKN
jgi:hypothetical protein